MPSLWLISPNAVGDAVELENREQRDPWRDRLGSDSVTNRVVNIRQDEMYSRIKKGKYVQIHKFYLTESKKTDTSLENQAGRWLLSRECRLL